MGAAVARSCIVEDHMKLAPALVGDIECGLELRFVSHVSDHGNCLVADQVGSFL